MRRIAFCAVVTLLFACTASAADIVIRPGAAIGKLRLGMVESDARLAYAYPYAEREDRPFGRERVEMSFGLSGYSAVLYGAKGRARVVRIETLSAQERTPEGVGVGTTEANLMRAYGKRLRCDPPHRYVHPGGMVTYGDLRACYLLGPGVETVFVNQMIEQRRGIAQFIRKWIPRKARVLRIAVQTVPQPQV